MKILNDSKSIQDKMESNHCFGCGANNKDGLNIKSYWTDEGTIVCHFMPESHQCAGKTAYLNGGITSTIIDCHSVCSAIAAAYQAEGRDVGEGKLIQFVTGNLSVAFLRPVPMNQEVELMAKVIELKEKKIVIDCTLTSDGKICSEAKVVAVRISDNW